MNTNPSYKVQMICFSRQQCSYLLHVLFHLTLKIVLRGKEHYPHVIDEETEELSCRKLKGLGEQKDHVWALSGWKVGKIEGCLHFGKLISPQTSRYKPDRKSCPSYTFIFRHHFSDHKKARPTSTLYGCQEVISTNYSWSWG